MKYHQIKISNNLIDEGISLNYFDNIINKNIGPDERNNNKKLKSKAKKDERNKCLTTTYDQTFGPNKIIPQINNINFVVVKNSSTRKVF